MRKRYRMSKRDHAVEQSSTRFPNAVFFFSNGGICFLASCLLRFFFYLEGDLTSHPLLLFVLFFYLRD